MTSRILVLALLCAGTACSMLNRDGPDVSCGDLDNGARNACQAGIIARCVGGDVKYQVCDDKNACDASWQSPDHYRCDQSSSPGSGGGGGSSGSGGSGGSGGTGGSTGCDPNGPCEIATTTGGFGVDAYTVDATTAFYATSQALFSVPKAGGVPTSLASGPNADSYGEIAVDDRYVYLLRDQGNGASEVDRAKKTGGSFETVVQATNHFAIDSANIYWAGLNSTHTSLFRRAKASGSPEVVIDTFDPPGWDTRIAVYQSYLYWLGNGGKVYRIDKTATSGTPVATTLTGSLQQDLAVDADGIFFTVSDGIGKMGLADISATYVVKGLDGLDHITTAGNYIYVEGSTGVSRVSKQGGQPFDIYTVAGGGHFCRIVVDDTYVYWAEADRLMRAPR